MAISALPDKLPFYDPQYRPEQATPYVYRNHCWFDDFSISEHLHILKPQSVDVNPTSLFNEYPVRNLLRSSASFNKVERSVSREELRGQLLSRRSASFSILETQSKCELDSNSREVEGATQLPTTVDL